MTAGEERPDALTWLGRARTAARAAFFSRRHGGSLARIVHDSLVDSDATPADHNLRFEHDHDLTIHLRIVTVDDHIALSGCIDPADDRSLALHSSGPRAPLESKEKAGGGFSFPPVPPGLVRMQLDGPGQPTVWSDWFRV